MHSAPRTFVRKTDAERYLSVLEAQVLAGDWTDPTRGRIVLRDYAEAWISERPGLRPRTVALYTSLLEHHIVPYLGQAQLGKIDTAMVRRWRTKLLESGVSATTTAKAYRLLRAVLMTASREDRIIPRNPCQVKGADQEHAAERPTLTVAEVFALAKAVPERFRAMVLLASFAGLRYGELVALERRDVNVKDRTVRVRQAYVELPGRGPVLGPPKSSAGKRTVAVPPSVADELDRHLRAYVGPELSAHVFTGPKGAVIRRGNFRKLIRWREGLRAIARSDVHFHDLRHTGNALAASTGASLRDLMARMGHDSVAAAMIYQHQISAAGRAIADALESHIEAVDAAEDQASEDQAKGELSDSDDGLEAAG